MNPLTQSKKTTILPLLIPLLLVSFALLPRTQAVVPAPDGGYAGNNTAEGTLALFSSTSGIDNTALGFTALFHNTTGNYNTAEGFRALFKNTSGTQNTATGVNALVNNTTGNFNTADGVNTLYRNTTGVENTATGVQALFNNTTGIDNTATGDIALERNTTGDGNTANGVGALFFNTTGNQNTALGADAGIGVTTANNVICIGAGVNGANVNNSCFIGQIYSNVQPIVGTNPDFVTITNTGRLGRGGVSSRRYKHDIKPMDKASEALFALKPVSFRYNKQYDATQTIAFGLIAEEVAEVYPDLVGRNPEGQPESVRYEQVNAMLLNEFLKEHRKVEKQEATITQLKSTAARQEATIAQQQKRMEAVIARLEEQAAQIQKVSAQLEVNKTAPQIVLNNQ
jgi:uncharacterized coiled-coil protein SlyX